MHYKLIGENKMHYNGNCASQSTWKLISL